VSEGTFRTCPSSSPGPALVLVFVILVLLFLLLARQERADLLLFGSNMKSFLRYDQSEHADVQSLYLLQQCDAFSPLKKVPYVTIMNPFRDYMKDFTEQIT